MKVIAEINKLKIIKSANENGILAEVLKFGGEVLKQKIANPINTL